MPEEIQSVEATNPLLGSLKVSGGTVGTILSAFGFIIIVLVAFLLWQHHVDSKENDKTALSVIQENRINSNALKETSVATNRLLEKIVEHQARAVEAQREANCLLALPQDKRTNSSEFCKRIAR